MYVEDLARIAHEVNRAYCRTLGDLSQPSWQWAPDWQKTSALNGVRAHLVNPELTPAQSHDNWLAEKALDGWVYGAVKDPEKKTHPCMLAYSDLPAEQRAKDHLFKAVIDSLRDQVEAV